MIKFKFKKYGEIICYLIIRTFWFSNLTLSVFLFSFLDFIANVEFLSAQRDLTGVKCYSDLSVTKNGKQQ